MTQLQFFFGFLFHTKLVSWTHEVGGAVGASVSFNCVGGIVNTVGARVVGGEVVGVDVVGLAVGVPVGAGVIGAVVVGTPVGAMVVGGVVGAAQYFFLMFLMYVFSNLNSCN